MHVAFLSLTASLPTGSPTSSQRLSLTRTLRCFVQFCIAIVSPSGELSASPQPRCERAGEHVSTARYRTFSPTVCSSNSSHTELPLKGNSVPLLYSLCKASYGPFINVCPIWHLFSDKLGSDRTGMGVTDGLTRPLSSIVSS